MDAHNIESCRKQIASTEKTMARLARQQGRYVWGFGGVIVLAVAGSACLIYADSAYWFAPLTMAFASVGSIVKLARRWRQYQQIRHHCQRILARDADSRAHYEAVHTTLDSILRESGLQSKDP